MHKLNEVLSSKKSFLADPVNSVSFGIAALFNIIHWVILSSKIGLDQNKIILHYNVVYGPDFVDNSIYIYFIPALAFLIFLVNLILASFFYKKEILVTYFLSITTIVLQIVFFVASLLLIIINE